MWFVAVAAEWSLEDRGGKGMSWYSGGGASDGTWGLPRVQPEHLRAHSRMGVRARHGFVRTVLHCGERLHLGGGWLCPGCAFTFHAAARPGGGSGRFCVVLGREARALRFSGWAAEGRKQGKGGIC
jgi:hypothetical protein